VGSLGIQGVVADLGGSGWAKPTHYPHFFTFVPATPKEPVCYFW
jgi:hypothetical protein